MGRLERYRIRRQTWTSRWFSIKLWISEFIEIPHMKMASFSALNTSRLCQQKTTPVLISVKVWVDPADPSPPSSAVLKKITAIPLLPLWAVRSVQSLSVCTVQLYLYSPYGPYGLYRTSVPVQYSYTATLPMGRTACTEPQCLYSTAIPLLSLWAIRPVHSLSACTVQLYLYSPMRHTACTQPQCLYSRAIPLLPYAPYGLYKASVPVQYSYTSTPLCAVRPVQSLSACTWVDFTFT